METTFEKFIAAFPIVEEGHCTVDAQKLVKEIKKVFDIDIPQSLQNFWQELGAGYFGKHDLYFFGDGRKSMERDSLIEWNKKDFWHEIYPPQNKGGPLFFAENSFGEQIGFRYERSKFITIIFIVDSFESFVLSDEIEDLFDKVLIDRYSLVEKERLDGVNKRLGILKKGMHYAPILSPLLGGTGNPENYHFETPNVHFRTSIATYYAEIEKQKR